MAADNPKNYNSELNDMSHTSTTEKLSVLVERVSSHINATEKALKLQAGDLETKLAVIKERLDSHIEATEKALQLQAEEYKRRLTDLNGEYKRDLARQDGYVSMDKYEDKIESMDKARIEALETEKTAREAALLRVDEKFEEYVKRWETIQADQAATITTLGQAAAEAKRIAEDQGRMTRAESENQARQQKDEAEKQFRAQQLIVAEQNSRNAKLGIAIAAIVSLIVAVANGVGPF